MSVIKEGWLEKKGGVRTNWKRRWFVLGSGDAGMELRYYEEKDGDLKGVIDLEDSSGARESQAPKAWPFEFEVITAGRTYRVRDTDQDGCAAWVEALCAIVGSAEDDAEEDEAAPHVGSVHTRSSFTPEGVPPGRKSFNGRASVLEKRMQEMNGFYDGQASSTRLVHDRWSENWENGRDMDGEALMKKLGTEYRKKQGIFVDQSFPPADSSLYRAGCKPASRSGGGAGRRDTKPFLEGREVVWKPPHEIMDPAASSVIFSGGIEPDDIGQGELGDCYYLAAMAACAANQMLIEDLIVEDCFDVGIVGVKFFKEGRWITVIVDYMLPCVRVGEKWQPVFCHPPDDSHEKELWCCYMEKAWAKLFGSYEVGALFVAHVLHP